MESTIKINELNLGSTSYEIPHKAKDGDDFCFISNQENTSCSLAYKFNDDDVCWRVALNFFFFPLPLFKRFLSIFHRTSW